MSELVAASNSFPKCMKKALFGAFVGSFFEEGKNGTNKKGQQNERFRAQTLTALFKPGCWLCLRPVHTPGFPS